MLEKRMYVFDLRKRFKEILIVMFYKVILLNKVILEN